MNASGPMNAAAAASSRERSAIQFSRCLPVRVRRRPGWGADELLAPARRVTGVVVDALMAMVQTPAVGLIRRSLRRSTTTVMLRETTNSTIAREEA